MRANVRTRSPRSAGLDDRQRIDGLLAGARWRHAHLDWLEAGELLGQDPFLVVDDLERPAACLACPPDPPGYAWIRVFASVSGMPPAEAWEALWPPAADAAVRCGARLAAALTGERWMVSLLRRSGFEETNRVVFLEHRGSPAGADAPPGTRLRVAQAEDFESLIHLDRQAFPGLWGYSPHVFSAALEQAALVTVLEADGEPVGYQLSTASALGAHLARLAVHPRHQGRGYGGALVRHLLHAFALRGFDRVSVNTQADNLASLRLYRRLRFVDTGQAYAVYTAGLGSGARGAS